ncbi:MAG: PIG-L family deacetylase [Anaerolineae bacterium]|nr:PIG-L family deacetylase [Anaerolineae bacterium]
MNSKVTPEYSASGEKLSLLAIFARSEDELFGPAGTLAKYASEGVEVSLVTATRSTVVTRVENLSPQRERSCTCRASGIRRACLFNFPPGELARVSVNVIEERVVRLIREVRPQVIVTFAPEGLTNDADADHRIISQVVTAAFRHAGDATQFAHHLREGLAAYQAQKLYYCVLPISLITHWGVQGLNAVPDERITTRLDVSAQSEIMKNALYCQRHRALDYIRWLTEEQNRVWNTEYYTLVESRLPHPTHNETDLFDGLR